MALLNKISSNSTGLRFAEEDTLKTVSGDEVWYGLDPNTYNEFGGEVQLVARNPINADRQNRKGVVTNLEAAGGWNNDLTQVNLQRLLQGFMFASFREKDNVANNAAGTPITDLTSNVFTVTAHTFVVGDLLKGSGFDDSANNVLMEVSAQTATTITVVGPTLVDDASPAAYALGVEGAKLYKVGHQFATDDLSVDVSTGSLPRLVSTAGFDMTTLGLVPGELAFLGGDAADEAFDSVGNTAQFVRVRGIVTTTLSNDSIELDKTSLTMVDEAGGGSETIRIFFGRVLKNEAIPANQIRRTYQLERSLSYPDDAATTELQAEYLTGAVGNEFTLNVASADKVTVDLGFLAAGYETLAAAAAPNIKSAVSSGGAPTLAEADAFNTSSDISRIKLSTAGGVSNPAALFAFATDLTLTISNNASAEPALGVLGALDIAVGNFTVGGSIEAYFVETAAMQSVIDNADITVEAHFVKANSGISFDIPLLSLGDGKLNVEKDQSIKIPLEIQAATGAKVHPTLDHTLLWVFWDYLPNAADA
jgi:hypothetical protein